MARRTLALVFAVLLSHAARGDGGAAGVTLLDPKGYVVLRKPGDVLRLRWQLNTTILKVVGATYWAAPNVRLRGKDVTLEVPYRTPVVPANGIIEIDVRYHEFGSAARAQDLSLEGAIDVDWKLEVRQRTPANSLVLAGEGRFPVNFESYAAFTVSFPPGFGEPGWPDTLEFKNHWYRRSNATTLRFRVKRLNEDQEVVRKHCPVRLVDADYPLPPTLTTPVKIALRKQTPTPAPFAPPPAGIVRSELPKGAGSAAAASTPTPPVVQEIVNCRFILTSTLPRADNPTAHEMTSQGWTAEIPLELTVRLK